MALDDAFRELIRGQLQRERRLLLAISLVLLAHQILGIKVSSSAESFGLHFDVANPERLWTAVWAVWLWATLRYAQLLNSFGPLSDFPVAREAETRERLYGWIAMRSVRKEARAIFNKEVKRAARVGIVITKVGQRRLTLGSETRDVFVTFNVVRTLRHEFGSHDRPKLSHIPPDSNESHKMLGWRRTGGGESLREKQGFYEVIDSVEISVASLERSLWLRLLAGAWTVLTTSFGTEYYAPLLIGLSPAIIFLLELPIGAFVKAHVPHWI
jgi:hypothetical protein